MFIGCFNGIKQILKNEKGAAKSTPFEEEALNYICKSQHARKRPTDMFEAAPCHVPNLQMMQLPL